MPTRRIFGFYSLSLAAALAGSMAAAVSGCQPKEPVGHQCSCICYKDAGKDGMYLLEQTVTTTKECGNVNGDACSGESGGKQIEGKYANCGPNPNVCSEFANAMRSALAAKISDGDGSGSGDGDGAEPSRTSGSVKETPR